MSALSNVFVCERFQTSVDCVGRVRPKNVSAEKLPKKVARLWRALLNSNRGMKCTQKLHVDFYTHKIVFEKFNTKIRSIFYRMNLLTKPTSNEYRLQSFVHCADSSTTAGSF